MTRKPEWLKTDHPQEVIEAALAHVIQNRVPAAYARSGSVRRSVLRISVPCSSRIGFNHLPDVRVSLLLGEQPLRGVFPEQLVPEAHCLFAVWGFHHPVNQQ